MYRVGIDISPLFNSNSIRGIGYYTENLISSLNKIALKNNLEIIPIENLDKISDLKIDLLHQPYFDPFLLQKISQYRGKKVVTIHDLIPIEFKQYYPAGIKGNILWNINRLVAKKFNAIITDSEYSKKTITRLLKVNSSNVYDILLAASAEFKPITKAEAKKLTANLKLPEKFVVYTGDVNWNKNVPNLAKACIKLRVPLVVIGKSAATNQIATHPWTQHLKELKSLQAQNPYLIITPGFLKTPILNAVYNLSSIYCQPSYAEGFGLGLLEAMQTGCPAISSNQTSLPEVAGPKLTTFNPYITSEPFKTLKRVLSNNNLLKTLSVEGIKQSKKFSWEKTAKETVNIYLKVINEK